MKSLLKIFLLAFLTEFGYTLHIPVNVLPNVTEEESTRIIGGVDAPDDLATYMVSLVVIHSPHFSQHICGASIIGCKVVLTAAHCIDAVRSGLELIHNLVGVVGSTRWQSTEHMIKFKSFVKHWDYNPWHIKNDVGVLITEHPIQMSSTVQPIKWKVGWVDGGEKAFATGWGMTEFRVPDKLQMLEVETITPQECVEAVHQASLEWGWSPPVDPKAEICTYHSFGHGMCMGDSGSALVHFKSKELIGVVSWGFACARGVPDMYVRISSFIDFIRLFTEIYKCYEDKHFS